MQLAIDVEDERWNAIAALHEKLAKAADAAAQQIKTDGEICLLLADDETLQNLNRQWRAKDRPTNVLSFPAPQGIKLPKGEIAPLGDIAMSYDTLNAEATRDEKSLSQHMQHLFIHGILHLLGYDHETESEAHEMEALEIEILSGLNIPNPYLVKDT